MALLAGECQRRSARPAAGFSLRIVRSADQLRALADQWDRLWQRSEVPLPTTQAEAVALWLEHFAPRATCHIITVYRGDELVAALPLYERRLYGRVPVGDVASNCWLSCGELLLDPGTCWEELAAPLAKAFAQCNWPLLWLDMVPIQSPRWQWLIGRLSQEGFSVVQHERYRIGRLALDGSLEQHLATCSRSHRQSVRRALRQLQRAGRVEFRYHEDFPPDNVARLLRDALAVEMQNNKKPTGCVLGAPGIWPIYCRVAELLASRRQLRLAVLLVDGRPVAFELGWLAKGVYHCHKIGYVAQFAHYSPGHVLRMKLLERLFDDPQCRAVDFQGPMTEAVRRWGVDSYPIARLVVAADRPSSRLVMTGYRLLAPVVRAARRLRKKLYRPPIARCD